MSIKLGVHVLGTKGSIKDRKGYVIHSDGNTVILMMKDSGPVSEAVSDVPLDAFITTRGRPVQIHSVVAGRRSVYSPVEKGGAPVSISDILAPAREPDGSFSGESIKSFVESIDSVAHESEVVPPSLTEDDLEQADNDPRGVVFREDDNLDVPSSKPRLKLAGEDGNAFMILGRAIKAAKQAGWSKDQIETFKKDATSGDYGNLLATVCRYFDTSDSDEE